MSPNPDPARPAIVAIGVTGIGEVGDGDDLAELIVAALAGMAERLADGDLLVISSKIASKAEGRALEAIGREAAIDAETVRVVAERGSDRGLTRVVQSRSGPVLAAAGVDASNVAPGLVLLLPLEPDRTARTVRHRVRELTGAQVGILISDTAGRPWREGQVDLAIGAAGVNVTDDLRGITDRYGNALEVTVRAVADELASAADLVKGKLDGVPVALLRGLSGLVTDDDGPGAAALLRGPASDWFRLGHVEAVRSALGAPPGSRGLAAEPMTPGTAVERLHRALDVALAGPDLIERAGRVEPWLAAVISEEFNTAMARALGQAAPAVVGSLTVPDDDRASVARAVVIASEGGRDRAVADPADTLALGGFVQRVVTAAWAEDLVVRASLRPDGAVMLVAAVPPPGPDAG